MASLSASTVSNSSLTSSSTSLKGLKKVLSNRRRSSEIPSEPGTRSSIDSGSLARSPTAQSATSSPSRDESASAGNAVRKLIPGHGKRQRKRQRDEEIKAALESDIRGRPTDPAPATSNTAASNTAASKSNSSLLTDADVETPPPLVSRDSHSGYFTTSSPLISTKAVNEDENSSGSGDIKFPVQSTTSFPSIVEPNPSPPDTSPRSTPKLTATPSLPPPGPIGATHTLQVETVAGRRNSIGKLRGKSPARKVRDMFSKAGRSPRSSPERDSAPSLQSSTSVSEENLSELSKPRAPGIKRKSVPKSLVNNGPSTNDKTPLVLDTNPAAPKTPPSAVTVTPSTTITPPTPTEKKRELPITSQADARSSDSDNSGITISHSGNMISHRRVRSASSATHSKSKLSTSMTAPLTPTIEEIKSSDKAGASRNTTPGGGFFSSWVSVAQSAASTLTNLTAQNRTRSGTTGSDPSKVKQTEDPTQEDEESSESAMRKQLAVETLGSGDLNFSHLGIAGGGDDKDSASLRPNLADLRQNSEFTRNEARAKEEDILAQKAVSAAYQTLSEGTPVAEVSDPLANHRHSQLVDATTGVNSTTPNGSIFEGETGPVKRTNSVRSKLANRRSRGSSIATGQSTIGAIIGASTAALASPGSASKPTGFTAAPKARNRTFHQLFRSVPEDDSLIEDYSCALQKEILLAGRIYISEGHICFSSNILGWVTTLIISFEEIVSVERENTAMIIPNAIAIQTLHARHTFRSLLSREATFDLMIGIWKVNHPTSFQKSVNGKRMVAEQIQTAATKSMGPTEEESPDSDDDSDGESGSESGSDEDNASAPSMLGSNASVSGSEFVDAKSIARKPSGINGAPVATGSLSASAGDVAAAAAVAGVAGTLVDFPGPATHGPTECTDSATHFDKVLKDDVIPAPLGKVYSLLYGPQSGTFVRKYLADDCKCTDLVLEDDKKGLNNDAKSRQYSYTKPLNAPIGPKSTKCITTETLDFFDLEKSVSVTCTTQTPNVPSGGAFSTKTRYCLSWAPGNATRFQMNYTIEWTAKSWLKGPIESNAGEGQQQYGDGLVKSLKSAVGRSRATTVGSKGPKSKKKRKGERKSRNEKAEEPTVTSKSWGLMEPLRPALEPIVSIISPVVRMDLVVTLLVVMVFTMWFGGRTQSAGGRWRGASIGHADRIAMYEELWQKHDGELWDWLERRAGIDRVAIMTTQTGQANHDADAHARRRQEAKLRAKHLKGKDMAAKMRAEKWNRQEIQDAVRVTKERLEAMQHALDGDLL